MFAPTSIYPARLGASALLLTLWCVGVLTLSVFVIVRLVEFDIDDERFESMRVEARELALTGLALAQHPDIKRGDPLLMQELPGNRGFQVSIESENARLNINRALAQPASPVLKDLFERWDVPDRDRSMIVDSLFDWVDEDDLRSLNGAEFEDLLGQSRYSIPANRGFVSVQEMERVRGVDVLAEVQPGWKSYFSVFSGEKLDIHDAPLDWLVIAGGLSEPLAEEWIKARAGPDGVVHTEDDLRLQSVSELGALMGLNAVQLAPLEENFDVNSEIIRISSLATVQGVRYEIIVVVQADADGAPPSYLSWEEE